MNYKIAIYTILIVGILGIAYGFSRNESQKPIVVSTKTINIQSNTIDSLQNVVDSLRSDITLLEKEFDSKEEELEHTIFLYEMGLGYLNDYHPIAYKDFHRIIGMRERYTIELERENIKKLSIK